jgi:hypothetical protein
LLKCTILYDVYDILLQQQYGGKTFMVGMRKLFLRPQYAVMHLMMMRRRRRRRLLRRRKIAHKAVMKKAGWRQQKLL